MVVGSGFRKPIPSMHLQNLQNWNPRQPEPFASAADGIALTIDPEVT
jgi:hypothetical protein